MSDLELVQDILANIVTAMERMALIGSTGLR
jgi:hypothetical protein